MKKVISILLAAVLLLSLGVTGWAEESGITAEKVLQWLEEGDDASETPEDQIANGALRLAEMTVVLDSLYVETEDEVAHLNNMLDKLTAVDVADEIYQNKIAVGLMQALNGLLFFEQKIDREGSYEDALYQIIDSFNEGDDRAESSTAQSVNALYHCVFTASLILQQLCTDEQMLAQVQAELNTFAEGEAAAVNVTDQVLNGGETLFRLLTAIASVIAPDESFAEQIYEISENTYAAAEAESDLSFQFANWLYGCVAMTGRIAAEVQA